MMNNHRFRFPIYTISMKSSESKFEFVLSRGTRCFLCFVYSRGPFSVVRRCTNKAGDKQYAVKIIDVEQFTSTPGFSADGKLN